MKKVLIIFIAIISSLGTLHASEKKDVLNIAYYLPSMKNIDAKDIKISLEFWAKELSLQTDMSMSSYFYKNINKLKKDFDAGNIDVVAASSLVFIQNFDLSTLTDGFKSIGKDDEGQNKLLLIVQKDSVSVSHANEIINKTISLEQAIKIALTNSEKNRISKYDMQIAQMQYKQAMSANLPSLDLEIAAVKRDENIVNITQGEFALPQDISNALALISTPPEGQAAVQQAIATGMASSCRHAIRF